MEYTINKLASLAGITTRTLRYYDQIGLLTPARTTQAGYRLYSSREVNRLQHILFYRALDLPLNEIATFLDAPDFDRAGALEGHLRDLEARRTQLDDLILTVKQSILSEKGGHIMSDSEKFSCFKQRVIRENEAAHGAEVRTRYGDGAMDEANARLAALTQEEYNAWTALGQEIRTRLEKAVRADLPPDGEVGQAIALLHRTWLAYSWQRYSPQAHGGLVQLYTEDPRFTAYYDGMIPGCGAFLRSAVETYIATAME